MTISIGRALAQHVPSVIPFGITQRDEHPSIHILIPHHLIPPGGRIPDSAVVSGVVWRGVGGSLGPTQVAPYISCLIYLSLVSSTPSCLELCGAVSVGRSAGRTSWQSRWSHWLSGSNLPVYLTTSCATTPPKNAHRGCQQDQRKAGDMVRDGMRRVDDKVERLGAMASKSAHRGCQQDQRKGGGNVSNQTSRVNNKASYHGVGERAQRLQERRKARQR
jgi:hypothetical protein